MSWWNKAGIGNLATAALKSAQTRIDKVLDIAEDEEGGSVVPSIPVVTSSVEPEEQSSPPADAIPTDDAEFWNTWLSADKLKAKAKGRSGSPNPDIKECPTSPPEGNKPAGYTSQLFSGTLSSLTNIQTLKSAGASILKKAQQQAEKSEPSAGLAEDPCDVSTVTALEAADTSQDGQGEGVDGGARDGSDTSTCSKPVTEPLKIEVPLASPHDNPPGVGLLATENTINMDRDAANTDSNNGAEEGSVQSSNDSLPVEEGEESLLSEPEGGQVGWGDVSLSILTESQVSSASSINTDNTDVVGVTSDAPPTDTGHEMADESQVQQTGSGTSLVETMAGSHSDQNEEVPVSLSNDLGEQLTASVAVSENAWGIPELTESALEIISTVVEEPVSSVTEEKPVDAVDSADSQPVEGSHPNSSDGKSTEIETVLTQDSVPSEGEKTPVSEVEQLPNQPEQDMSTEAQSEGAATPISDSRDLLVTEMLLTKESSSMEGSTDTQDGLSCSNRTLCSEELEQPRLSSESSQATLELNQEEDQLGETDGNIPEEASDKPLNIPEEKEDKSVVRSGQKEPLTSSSYVKNMLEEAMVESVKDTDSHTDSHSHTSSDMVRIESGPTSGHTSADEIETNTSSDIEIISHISTPTPNGEARYFDLSPLRHAFTRTMRRNSPPGHKRSDSGSSSQSRNGDDLVSPLDGSTRAELEARLSAARMNRMEPRKSEEGAVASSALETDKLLKLLDSKPIIPLQPIQENLENVTMKLAETAEVLDARERKVMDLSRENIDLIETNNILRQQLQQSEEAREAEMTDLNTLTEEFTIRMSEAEKKIQSVIKEKDTIRKKLLETEAELSKRANDKAMERIMREKDLQINELLEEGEKLSKQQLQSNNIIKKLRVKEKENDTLIKSQRAKVDEQKAEIEKLMLVLDNKVDNEQKQSDAINQLNNAVLMQETEINRLKSELEDLVEKNRSLQVTLDNSYKEIADLHKSKVARASEAQGQALSAEIQAKEELQMALDHAKHRTKLEQEALVTQIEDLQLSLGRCERESGRREDVLRQDISDLQKRLQEAENRNQELTQSVTQATRPLLRQIENLQSTFAAQATSYERVERNLTDRLGESQTSLALAQEKERSAGDRVLEVDVKLSTLDSQISQLRHDKSRLQANLEMEKTKLEVAVDGRNNESAQLETIQLEYNREISDLKKDRMMLDNQLEMEKLRTEAKKKKVPTATLR